MSVAIDSANMGTSSANATREITAPGRTRRASLRNRAAVNLRPRPSPGVLRFTGSPAPTFEDHARAGPRRVGNGSRVLLRGWRLVPRRRRTNMSRMVANDDRDSDARGDPCERESEDHGHGHDHILP